jgi:ADP-glucose pyrophosphorylase
VLPTLESRPEHFLIMNGDILTNIDFDDLLKRHVELGAPMTVATYDREHRVDFGVLDVAGERVTCFREKPMYTYTVSMGVYAVAKKTLRRYLRRAVARLRRPDDRSPGGGGAARPTGSGLLARHRAAR